RLLAGRARFTLPTARTTLAAGERRLLRVRIGPRALRAARRALRRGARVRAALSVRAARVGDGGATRRTLRVGLTR
ncbi:MAG TPA: hypothetical protein VGW75_11340, partial [Solirubrobacteraceae bacterium]|nr:hypothetical protein [Solirubrobacteraceae bacterium]